MFALPLIYLVLRPDARRRLHKAGVLVASVFIPGGCALQAPYTTPEMASPKAWSVNSGPALAATADTPNAHPEPLWWLALGDAAINALTESACADSPSLTQAVARIDEARATLGLNRAAQTPTIGINASLSRAQSQNTSPQSSGATQLSTRCEQFIAGRRIPISPFEAPWPASTGPPMAIYSRSTITPLQATASRQAKL